MRVKDKLFLVIVILFAAIGYGLSIAHSASTAAPMPCVPVYSPAPLSSDESTAQGSAASAVEDLKLLYSLIVTHD